MNTYQDEFLNKSLQSKLSPDPSLSLDSSNPLDTRIPTRSNVGAALTQPQTTYSSSETGVFTVGTSGKVSFDFLFDGGAYEGEAAVFNLAGMERYAPGSVDFIREATRRALSNSNEGYIFTSDLTESAQYSGRFRWEQAYNSGRYMGVKTFAMTPGDQFALMLVPNGTVQEVFNDPSLGAAKRPLFSIASANPKTTSHFGGIKNVNANGQVIGIEDLREDGDSDIDFDDVIFYVEGATGSVVPIDSLIDPSYEWRSDPMGQQILAFTPLPGSGDSGIKNSVKPQEDPTKWNISFVNFNNGTIPTEPDFTNAAAFSIIDIQRDKDGIISLSQDFGDKSPAPNVQNDYFGLQAWTRLTDLDPAQLYKVTTQSDDGTQFFLKNTKTSETKKLTDLGAESNGDWRDHSVTDPAKDLYFKVPDKGDYDLYVQYYDKTGNAALNVTFGKVVPFLPQSPIDKAKNWQADVYWFNRVTTKQPPAKNEDLKDKLGTIDLGSNNSGIKFDFGKDSPKDDSRLPSDNFAIVAYTEATFEDGKYTFQALGDDGFQIFIENPDGTNRIFITPENEWQSNTSSKSFSKEIKKGNYNVFVTYYEKVEGAKFDLSWTRNDVVPPPPPPPPGAHKYLFEYYYNGNDKKEADYYTGWVIAEAGKYQVDQFVNPSSDNNEVGKDGRYKIIKDDGKADIVDTGKVFVERYYDSETQTNYAPIKYLRKEFAGRAYLGSEVDYIRTDNSSDTDFGKDKYRYDVPKDYFLAINNPDLRQDKYWSSADSDGAFGSWSGLQQIPVDIIYTPPSDFKIVTVKDLAQGVENSLRDFFDVWNLPFADQHMEHFLNQGEPPKSLNDIPVDELLKYVPGFQGIYDGRVAEVRTKLRKLSEELRSSEMQIESGTYWINPEKMDGWIYTQGKEGNDKGRLLNQGIDLFEKLKGEPLRVWNEVLAGNTSAIINAPENTRKLLDFYNAIGRFEYNTSVEVLIEKNSIISFKFKVYVHDYFNFDIKPEDFSKGVKDKDIQKLAAWILRFSQSAIPEALVNLGIANNYEQTGTSSVKEFSI